VKTKVALIIDKLTTGGTQRHILNLLRYGDTLNFHNDVICLMKRGELAEEAEKLGADVMCLGLSKIYGCEAVVGFRRLVDIIRKGRYDIAVTHLFSSNVIGSPAARLGGAKIVIASRRQAAKLAPRELKIVRKLANRFVDYALANSNAVKEYVITNEKFNPDKIKIIYGGVDTDLFNSATADDDLFREIKLVRNVPVIASIARLSPEKGVLDLLDAVCELHRRGHECQLLLVGEGSLRKQLDDTIKGRKIENRVKLLGARKDVHKLLALVDVFVTASHSEGFSNALLEAGAAGKAIIATDRGGNPEFVEDGVTGLLIKSADPIDCADALQRLLGDAELRMMLGENAKKKARDEFDIRDSVARVEGVYRKLLGNKD